MYINYVYCVNIIKTIDFDNGALTLYTKYYTYLPSIKYLPIIYNIIILLFCNIIMEVNRLIIFLKQYTHKYAIVQFV